MWGVQRETRENIPWRMIVFVAQVHISAGARREAASQLHAEHRHARTSSRHQ